MTLPSYSSSRLPLAPLLLLLATLFLWESLHLISGLPEYLLPAPMTVLNRFLEGPYSYLLQVTHTFLEAAAGLGIAITVGLALASAASWSRPLEESALGFAGVLQTIPIIAIAPLIILWLGIGFFSKSVMAAIVASPPIAVSAIRGLRQTPDALVDTLRIMGCTEAEISRRIRLPFALRQVLTGLTVAASLAVIGAIVAEYTGAEQGVGYLIMQSSYRLDSAGLFIGVIGAVVSGWTLVKIVAALNLILLRIISDPDGDKT